MEELFYMIALTQVENVGIAIGKKLLSKFGSARDIFKEKEKNLMKIPCLGSNVVDNLKSKAPLSKAEEELDYVINNSIRVITFADDNYPYRLKQCSDAPILLYVMGNILPQKQKMLAVVGTRNATEYGKKVCNNIISDMKHLDVGIVSGLAYGIDTQSHISALNNDLSTFAVLGTGFRYIYPSVNKQLSEDISSKGCLITEFISTTKPDRENFPRRNRIIAGLSDAILVVEAAEKGGALITAELALSYDREVFAIPGKIYDKYSSGCNSLINKNKAIITLSANDIIINMNWDTNPIVSTERKLLYPLNDVQQQIYDYLEEERVCHIDKISKKVNLPIERLSCELLDMELNGIVKCMPGKKYENM